MPADQKNPHKDHRDRLRKRLVAERDSSIIQHELVEALLFYVIPVKDTNSVAHELINVFGSIDRILDASEDELIKVKGVKEKSVLYIKLLNKLVKICRTSCSSKPVYDLENDLVREYIRGLFADMKREQVYILFIDAKNQIMRNELMFEGTFENVDIDMKDVLRKAIEYDAKYIVCVHNHPSGIAKASFSDRNATKVMRESAKMIGIDFKDHLIVTENAIYGILSDMYIEKAADQGM